MALMQLLECYISIGKELDPVGILEEAVFLLASCRKCRVFWQSGSVFGGEIAQVPFPAQTIPRNALGDVDGVTPHGPTGAAQGKTSACPRALVAAWLRQKHLPHVPWLLPLASRMLPASLPPSSLSVSPAERLSFFSREPPPQRVVFRRLSHKTFTHDETSQICPSCCLHQDLAVL